MTETKTREENSEKKDNPHSADLSVHEDLAIGIMNLVSLEEHFFFSAMKTGDPLYLEYMNEMRSMRKEALQKIVQNPKGEEWCASKHLLAASMRFYEVGTKWFAHENKEEAQLFFEKSFQLFSLFFALNHKPALALEENGLHEIQTSAAQGTFMKKLTEAVKKLVDCCKE